MSDPTPGSLEEQALKRRQKLLSLKRKREGRPDPDGSTTGNPENEILPKPIFRSYVPLDDKLQENVVTDIRPEDITEQVCILFVIDCVK